MNAYDFTPLFRSGIGFERLVSALESAGRNEFQAYPPYDIEKTGDDEFRITVAVPGFSSEELEIETRDSALLLSATPAADDGERQFLHRGFQKAPFRRRFQLADHVSVVSARLDNGLLHIDLVRELPEALKPRTIPVETDKSTAGATTLVGESQRVLESDGANDADGNSSAAREREKVTSQAA